MLFAYTDNSRIESNTANSNDNYGIFLYHSSNNTLSNNTANSNDRGIYIWDSNNNTLANNTFINDGLIVECSYSNTVENNIVNSEPLAYLKDASDFIVQNAGQVILLNCTNITVKNLNRSNTSIGVEFWESDDCKIVDTIISNNLWGICLQDSNNNTLYHNNLINNTYYNAYDTGTNQWDSGSEGNYWSDYTGTDTNRDGIGDDPYDIPGDTSTDRFPLMQPRTGSTLQKGNLNADGILTPADAAIALRIAASSAHDDAADVSGDGCVTSLDALMLLQAAAGRIES